MSSSDRPAAYPKECSSLNPWALRKMNYSGELSLTLMEMLHAGSDDDLLNFTRAFVNARARTSRYKRSTTEPFFTLTTVICTARSTIFAHFLLRITYRPPPHCSPVARLCLYTSGSVDQQSRRRHRFHLCKISRDLLLLKDGFTKLDARHRTFQGFIDSTSSHAE